MIKLKLNYSKKHINIYVLKNNNNILSLSTKNYNLKNTLFRTNNLSAILILSEILAAELKRSGLNEPIVFECPQFKGNIIKFVENLVKQHIPVTVKII